MTQFHDGQEVEVNTWMGVTLQRWRAASVVCFKNVQYNKDCYLVQYPDGTRDALYAEHIRAAKDYTAKANEQD